MSAVGSNWKGSRIPYIENACSSAGKVTAPVSIIKQKNFQTSPGIQARCHCVPQVSSLSGEIIQRISNMFVLECFLLPYISWLVHNLKSDDPFTPLQEGFQFTLGVPGLVTALMDYVFMGLGRWIQVYKQVLELKLNWVRSVVPIVVSGKLTCGFPTSTMCAFTGHMCAWASKVTGLMYV